MNLSFLRCHACGSRFVKVDASRGEVWKAVICQSCGCMAEADNWADLSDFWVCKDYTIQPLPIDRRIAETELERRYGRVVPKLGDVLKPASVEQSSFDFGGAL